MCVLCSACIGMAWVIWKKMSKKKSRRPLSPSPSPSPGLVSPGQSSVTRPGRSPAIIQQPPTPPLPKLPTGIWDPFETKRGFRANYIEGTYCVLWYGKSPQSSIQDLKTLVANLDKWYLAIQNDLGYSVSRTIQEQLIEEYKFNVYFRESDFKGYPRDGNFLGGYGAEGRYVHYITTDEWAASHELGHLMQLRSKGFRNDKRVGWGWESNAHYIAYKMEGNFVGTAVDFLTRSYRKRMDSFEDGIQYRSWIWWICLETMHGPKFVGQLWSNVAQGTPQFEEVARLTTGGDVPTMFAQYVRCVMQRNFGDAELTKRLQNTMEFEQTTFRDSKIQMKTHRLERFGFVLVDIGSPTPTGQMYRAKIVPLDSGHPVDAWRGVFGNDILKANEWTRPFAGKKTTALGVTCPTRQGNVDVCTYEIHLEVVL